MLTVYKLRLEPNFIQTAGAFKRLRGTMNEHILRHEHLQFKTPSGTDSHLSFGYVKVIAAMLKVLILATIL